MGCTRTSEVLAVCVFCLLCWLTIRGVPFFINDRCLFPMTMLSNVLDVNFRAKNTKYFSHACIMWKKIRSFLTGIMGNFVEFTMVRVTFRINPGSSTVARCGKVIGPVYQGNRVLYLGRMFIHDDNDKQYSRTTCKFLGKCCIITTQMR